MPRMGIDQCKLAASGSYFINDKPCSFGLSLIAQRIDRVEQRGLESWIKSEEDPNEA